ncbi:MAG TPA: YqaA family protein [Flavobacteriales bacterium]|nr:YqaA family protein [Flavobacteriales bacterium]HRE96518.1 YqaA family protein [Flavobacteriales bacterium]HRJ38768.1 YqaA family protein [Flavobacteriales bacterium]
MDFGAGYAGLFLGCFVSATILPFASEAFVLAMLLGGFDPVAVVLVATLGNWLGGLTNYLLGYLADYHVLERRFSLKKDKIDRFKIWVDRYGVWVALITWVPVIGDPLTLVLGFFRTSFWKIAVLSLIGKCVRYIVMAWITLQF